MFSLGLVPYPSLRNRGVVQYLKDGERMEAPDNCPEQIYDIMLQCWSEDAESRPSMTALYDKLEDARRSAASAPVSI